MKYVVVSRSIGKVKADSTRWREQEATPWENDSILRFALGSDSRQERSQDYFYMRVTRM